MTIPRRSRRVMLTLAALSISAAVACADGASTTPAPGDVTSVENTNVKAQAIGNCWLYATAGWVESLHKGATERDIDVSEAYWNYWYWYEQISGGDIPGMPDGVDGHVEEGGWWGTSVELIRRYGWMYEGDFIPRADANAKRHEEAVGAINASLAGGALATPAARRDPRIVRDELNKAWKIDPIVVEDLERQFPIVGVRAPESSDPADANDGGAPSLPAPPIAHVAVTDRAAGGSLGLTRVHAPQEMQVIAADGTPSITLADAIGKMAPNTWSGDGSRVGPEAWSEVRYEWIAADTARRVAMLKNVQHTLNRRLAVPMAWTPSYDVTDGVYRASPDAIANISGLHESILVDYEVENVPGFGTLRVDVRETRPEALEATLADSAKVTFFRIKNSWGVDPVWTRDELAQFGIVVDTDAGTKPKPAHLPSKPGFNDIFVDYLDLEIPWGGNPPAHAGLRFALPSKLRFPIPEAIPAPVTPTDADGGAADAGP